MFLVLRSELRGNRLSVFFLNLFIYIRRYRVLRKRAYAQCAQCTVDLHTMHSFPRGLPAVPPDTFPSRLLQPCARAASPLEFPHESAQAAATGMCVARRDPRDAGVPKRERSVNAAASHIYSGSARRRPKRRNTKEATPRACKQAVLVPCV